MLPERFSDFDCRVLERSYRYFRTFKVSHYPSKMELTSDSLRLIQFHAGTIHSRRFLNNIKISKGFMALTKQRFKKFAKLYNQPWEIVMYHSHGSHHVTYIAKSNFLPVGQHVELWVAVGDRPSWYLFVLLTA